MFRRRKIICCEKEKAEEVNMDENEERTTTQPSSIATARSPLPRLWMTTLEPEPAQREQKTKSKIKLIFSAMATLLGVIGGINTIYQMYLDQFHPKQVYITRV